MSLPGQLLDVGGNWLFVHRRGAGTPLVLLHGYMMSHWYFRSIIGALAGEYDVIAVDLPGFGESDRPPPDRFAYGRRELGRVVVGVLDRLGIERALVLGHSMGGGVALSACVEAPERFLGVLCESGAVLPSPVLPLARRVFSPRIGELLFKRAYSKAHFARFLRAFSYGPAYQVSEQMVDFWWDRFCRPGGKDAAYAMLLELLHPLEQLDAVAVPVAVVWGENDALLPLPIGRRVAAALRANIRIVPVAGHTPHEERPELFLSMAIPMLGEIYARSQETSCRNAS